MAINEVHDRSVMIGNDTPDNLRLLAAVLRRGGFSPRPVTSGRLAIEAAVIDPPHLVLLDVRMPDMSGVDVCRWFKQDERLRSIPVIFISGLQGTDDKVEAFRAGAVDYVSRPFQEEEVLARIKTHLRLRLSGPRLYRPRAPPATVCRRAGRAMCHARARRNHHRGSKSNSALGYALYGTDLKMCPCYKKIQPGGESCH